MKTLIKNPISLWLKWYIQSRRLLARNRKKNLKIGYLSSCINVQFGNFNTIHNYVIVGNATLGNFVYVADNARIGNASIGNFCSIGPNVRVGLGLHPTHLTSTFPAFYSTAKQCQVAFTEVNHVDEHGKVILGNDVWVGYNATIMDNLSIGDGAIIAAGAVVTKDVAPYAIVGGVPAKQIRKRFSDEQIEKLLSIKWWDEEEDWIKENASLFLHPDDFINKFFKDR